MNLEILLHQRTGTPVRMKALWRPSNAPARLKVRLVAPVGNGGIVTICEMKWGCN